MVRCIFKSEKSKELQRKGNLKLSHTGTLTWFFFLLINAELKLFFLLWRKVLTMISSWEILKLNVIKLLKGLHVFFVKQSLSVFLPSAAILNVDFSWYLIYVKRGDLKNYHSQEAPVNQQFGNLRV